MNKRIYIGFAVAGLAILGMAVSAIVQWKNRPRLIIQEMECILEVPYDPASFNQFIPGSEITWWDQFHHKEDLNDEFETRRANVSTEDWDALEIDLDKFSYILSYGRKIVDIRYWNRKDEIFYSYSADVTFAEQYDGAVLYVYRGPRYSFLPFEDYKDIYIMQGDQRVYWGILYWINERMPSPDRGI